MQASPATNSFPHLDYRWVFAASLLVSAWLILMDPVINRDAIIYLRAADAYLQHGFAASQQEFGRPLLSICIALLNQWTGLSTLWAGLLIVSLSYAVLCTGFVATVHTLGGDRRVQLLAAILVLSHPMLNHTRSSIMRDPLYWALLIMSLREILLYLRQPSLLHQLRWTAYILLAALFRFEGLFIAALAPIALLFCRELPNRLQHCLRLLLPQLAAILAIAVTLGIYLTRQGEEANLFPAIQQYVDKFLALPAEFSAMAVTSAEPMLRFTSQQDAPIAILAGLAAVLLINLCRAITWPWLLVLLWGKRTHMLDRFRSSDQTMLVAHILITLVYLCLFMLINRFMLERYSNQVVIFLLLYLPFLLNSLWGAGGWKKYLVIVLLLGMSIDTLHTGESDKLFVREATDWVRENTPEEAKIASNEKYIAYFSRRNFNWKVALSQEFKLGPILEQARNWQQVDYLVIYVRARDEPRWGEFLADKQLSELESFSGKNPRKGRVAVVALRPAR